MNGLKKQNCIKQILLKKLILIIKITSMRKMALYGLKQQILVMTKTGSLKKIDLAYFQLILFII